MATKKKEKPAGVKLISTKGNTEKELDKELDEVLDTLFGSDGEKKTDKSITSKKPASLLPLAFAQAAPVSMKVKPQPKDEKHKPAKKKDTAK